MSNTMSNTELLVGIDASQKTNQCCLLDHTGSNGKVIKEVDVTNNVTGAHELEAVLATYAQKFQTKELKVATEATSFYDFHILEFLSESEILVEHNLKLYRFKDKTDPEDAYAIAEYLRFRGEKAEKYRAKMDHLPLQRLTRFRNHLVQQLVREKNYFLIRVFQLAQ